LVRVTFAYAVLQTPRTVVVTRALLRCYAGVADTFPLFWMRVVAFRRATLQPFIMHSVARSVVVRSLFGTGSVAVTVSLRLARFVR
jgi:hypothetical protein